MSRISPLPREQLTDVQKELHDEILNKTQGAFGPNGAVVTYQDDQGALIGPLPFYLAVPEAGASLLKVAVSLFQVLLSAQVKEIAILVVGSRYQAAYQLYAHGKIGEAVGLSSEQVEKLKKGGKPEDLDEQGCVAFEAAQYLSSKPGLLPKELWERSVSALGREGTATLVHYVGYYAYACIVLNAIDAPVPTDG